MRQLNDRNVYILLEHNTTEAIIDKVNERVKRLHREGHIGKSSLEYLLVKNDVKAGRFS